MKITAVSIKLFAKNKLKAFATITIDDALVIRGIKIIEGKKGLFVAMPNRQRPDSSYQDIAHPVTVAAREDLERIVLEAYRKACFGLNGKGPERAAGDRAPDASGDGMTGRDGSDPTSDGPGKDSDQDD